MLVEDSGQILLHSIMENSKDIITVKDLDFNYKICNRAFLKLLNLFHESSVLGKNIKDVLSLEAYETILKNLNYVLEMREPIVYTFNIEINNEILVLSQLSTPIVENGEITGILSVAKDITNEENLKLKLVEKICELNSIIDEKKQLEKQKEMFLTTLTHDLKNPVQAQIMSLKLLKNGRFGELNDGQLEIISTLLESSDYVQNMLYSILKTYKYDNGMIQLNKDFIDVDLMIKRCINEVDAFAKNKNIKILYNSFINGNKLYADYEQLRRVISNLINNALNYSYKNTDFAINVSLNENKMIFTFSNVGHPIKDKDKIFEKYYTSKNLSGTGLGLYFCKKVVEAHNGILYLETNNELSRFIFELPLKEVISRSVVFG